MSRMPGVYQVQVLTGERFVVPLELVGAGACAFGWDGRGSALAARRILGLRNIAASAKKF